jgi:hypothetical protein
MTLQLVADCQLLRSRNTRLVRIVINGRLENLMLSSGAKPVLNLGSGCEPSPQGSILSALTKRGL